MKSTSFKSVAAKISAVLLSCLVLFSFVGCPEPQVGPATIYGTWNGPYAGEVYTITETSFESQNTYAGNNLNVSYEDDTETCGYLYIQYTKVYDWSNPVYTDPNDSTYLHYSYTYDGVNYEMWYPLNDELIGKWYAVRFENLTVSTVHLSGAVGAVKGCDTLEDAKTTFTVANGYFNGGSDCTK